MTRLRVGNRSIVRGMDDDLYYGYRRDQLEKFTRIVVNENNKRTRIFIPETIPAYVTLLCKLEAWKGDLAVARKRSLAIRTLGAPVTPDVRSGLGNSKRVDLGDVFVASLTGIGRSDPKLAAEALSYWPCHMVSNLFRLNLCISDRSLAYHKVDVRVCCEAAVGKSQTFISVPMVEMFPLDTCKNWRCSCGFDRGGMADPALSALPDEATAILDLNND